MTSPVSHTPGRPRGFALCALLTGLLSLAAADIAWSAPIYGYGKSVTTLGDVKGDGASDVAVGAPGADGPVLGSGGVFITYDTPDSAGGTFALYGDEPGEQFGWSVAGVGDVNGDGFPDLLVGAPQATAGGAPVAGKAYLYLGTAFGFQSTPSWIYSPADSFAQFGYSVAAAGDINGDGYADWLVGAPYHTHTQPSEGAVYLFLGGPGNLPTAPAWFHESGQANSSFGLCVSGAGDVNADGYDDLLVSAPDAVNTLAYEGGVFLWLGHPGGPSVNSDRVFWGGIANLESGNAVAPAGDVNGDGYADFIVGSAFYDQAFTNQGRVQVFHGAALPSLIGSPDALTLAVNVAHFGAAVGPAGDVNGDGLADIVIGAPAVVNATNHGTAKIYLGTPSGVSHTAYATLTDNVSGDVIGASVATMGDVNGDGYGDCFVGVTNSAGTGHTLQLLGAPTAASAAPDVFASEGFVGGLYFGSTGAAVDVNGDGYDDLVIGTWRGDTSGTNPGSLALYLGGPSPFPLLGVPPFNGAVPDWTYFGQTYDEVGLSLARAGDVNGDGYDDFIAGAPYHAHPFSSCGEAILFYGSPSGPAASAPWMVEGPAADAHFGYSVAGGDFNGDGYADVAVGADNVGTSPLVEGQVFIYYGSRSGLAHTAGVVLHGGQTGCQFGSSCAVPGDVNGDGYDDLVVGAPVYNVDGQATGRVFLFLGGPTGLAATPAQFVQPATSGGSFGQSVVRAGDLNGDGYADVAVAAPQVSDPETFEGEVFVYYGSPTGLVDPAGWTLEGDQVNAFLGWYGIASAGDFDGDGYADLLVGAPQGVTTGAHQYGRVRVYPGAATGLLTAPIVDEIDSVPDAFFSTATGAGDFNGDGHGDLFFTSPGWSGDAGANEGMLDVRFGATTSVPAGNLDRPIVPFRSDDSAPIGLGLRSDANTSFRFHARGRSPAGRSKVQLEWEVVPRTTPFQSAGHQVSPWQRTGAPVAGTGSTAAIDALVSGLVKGAGYHWRARVRTASIFFPQEPWSGPSLAGRTERALSTAGAGVAGVGDAGTPASDVALAAPSPNPAPGRAALTFSLARAGQASLALYDVRGRLVRRLFDGLAPAGRTSLAWDGADDAGRAMPAGLYLVRLAALGREAVTKLTRVR